MDFIQRSACQVVGVSYFSQLSILTGIPQLYNRQIFHVILPLLIYQSLICLSGEDVSMLDIVWLRLENLDWS